MIRHLQFIIKGKVENTGFRLYALWGASECNIKGEAWQHEGKIIVEAEGYPIGSEPIYGMVQKRAGRMPD
jgi:acylphosphatase